MRGKYLLFQKIGWGSHEKRMLISVRQSIVWSCVTSSIILQTTGKGEIGLQLLGSLLVPYLYKELGFVSLQLFRNWDNLMDKSQICVM